MITKKIIIIGSIDFCELTMNVYDDQDTVELYADGQLIGNFNKDEFKKAVSKL